jgi:hypothetical protein
MHAGDAGADRTTRQDALPVRTLSPATLAPDEGADAPAHAEPGSNPAVAAASQSFEELPGLDKRRRGEGSRDKDLAEVDVYDTGASGALSARHLWRPGGSPTRAASAPRSAPDATRDADAALGPVASTASGAKQARGSPVSGQVEAHPVKWSDDSSPEGSARPASQQEWLLPPGDAHVVASAQPAQRSSAQPAPAAAGALSHAQAKRSAPAGTPPPEAARAPTGTSSRPNGRTPATFDARLAARTQRPLSLGITAAKAQRRPRPATEPLQARYNTPPTAVAKGGPSLPSATLLEPSMTDNMHGLHSWPDSGAGPRVQPDALVPSEGSSASAKRTSSGISGPLGVTPPESIMESMSGEVSVSSILRGNLSWVQPASVQGDAKHRKAQQQSRRLLWQQHVDDL